jgi:hypothetical protein
MIDSIWFNRTCGQRFPRYPEEKIRHGIHSFFVAAIYIYIYICVSRFSRYCLSRPTAARLYFTIVRYLYRVLCVRKIFYLCSPRKFSFIGSSLRTIITHRGIDKRRSCFIYVLTNSIPIFVYYVVLWRMF